MKKTTMKKKKEEDRTGLFVPAGLLIGMGLGFIFGHLVGGLLLGLGAGVLGMAILKNFTKQKN